MFGAEVWGCAAHSKYLVQIDRLLNRAFRFGYVQKRESILDIIYDGDLLPWNKITSGKPNGLEKLLPQNVKGNCSNKTTNTDCHGSEHSVLRIVL